MRTKKSVWSQNKEYEGGAIIDPWILYISCVIQPCSLASNKLLNFEPCYLYVTHRKRDCMNFTCGIFKKPFLRFVLEVFSKWVFLWLSKAQRNCKTFLSRKFFHTRLLPFILMFYLWNWLYTSREYVHWAWMTC